MDNVSVTTLAGITLMMVQLARGGRNTAQIPPPLKAVWFPDPVHQL